MAIAHRRAIDVGRARSPRAVPTGYLVERGDRPDGSEVRPASEQAQDW